MRPNIVIINPDQMRSDSMHHLGNPASITPNLDGLAQEGISFSNAFCQNPVCSPSRCSFMSGWYPHVAGHRTMEYLMQPDEPVLLRYLKNCGYHVWMNQRNDFLPAQHPERYEDYCSTYFRLQEKPEPLPPENWRGDPGGSRYYSFFRGRIPAVKDIDTIWVQGAVDFITSYDRDEPFCLFLPLMLPHPVYQICEPFFSSIDRNRIPARIRPPDNYQGKPEIEKALHELYRLDDWAETEYTELRAVYLAMCSKVDYLTGLVLDALKKSGVYDNTAVFFFSDHGDFTGDYGLVEKAQNCFEDVLVNVPFILKPPRALSGRTGIGDPLIELIDFYATVEELAGFKSGHTHFGQSLLPYIRRETESVRTEVFCEGGFRKGESYCSEAGGPGGLTKENLYYPRISLQISDKPFNGKGIMCRTNRFKYIKRLYEQDELYDLEKDPEERENRIDDASFEMISSEMKERILNHYLDTCDVVPFEKDIRMDTDLRCALSGH
jgi:arylsulfatase A-like enzyme